MIDENKVREALGLEAEYDLAGIVPRVMRLFEEEQDRYREVLNKAYLQRDAQQLRANRAEEENAQLKEKLERFSWREMEDRARHAEEDLAAARESLHEVNADVYVWIERCRKAEATLEEVIAHRDAHYEDALGYQAKYRKAVAELAEARKAALLDAADKCERYSSRHGRTFAEFLRALAEDSSPSPTPLITDHPYRGGTWSTATCNYVESSGCSWYECNQPASKHAEHPPIKEQP